MPIVPVTPALISPPPRRRSPLQLTSPVDQRSDHSPEQTSASRAPDARDYEVGYCKPPKHSRFKPGQSGNPKGRPKGAKGFHTIIREAMLKPVVVRTSRGTKKITSAEALVLRALESGTKGDLRAIEKLLTWYNSAMPQEAAQRPQLTSDEPTPTDEASLTEFLRTLEGDHDRNEEKEARS